MEGHANLLEILQSIEESVNNPLPLIGEFGVDDAHFLWTAFSCGRILCSKLSGALVL